MRFIRRVTFLIFSGILIGYEILLALEVVLLQPITTLLPAEVALCSLYQTIGEYEKWYTFSYGPHSRDAYFIQIFSSTIPGRKKVTWKEAAYATTDSNCRQQRSQHSICTGTHYTWVLRAGPVGCTSYNMYTVKGLCSLFFPFRNLIYWQLSVNLYENWREHSTFYGDLWWNSHFMTFDISKFISTLTFTI